MTCDVTFEHSFTHVFEPLLGAKHRARYLNSNGLFLSADSVRPREI